MMLRTRTLPETPERKPRNNSMEIEDKTTPILSPVPAVVSPPAIIEPSSPRTQGSLEMDDKKMPDDNGIKVPVEEKTKGVTPTRKQVPSMVKQHNVLTPPTPVRVSSFPTVFPKISVAQKKASTKSKPAKVVPKKKKTTRKKKKFLVLPLAVLGAGVSTVYLAGKVHHMVRVDKVKTPTLAPRKLSKRKRGNELNVTSSKRIKTQAVNESSAATATPSIITLLPPTNDPKVTEMLEHDTKLQCLKRMANMQQGVDMTTSSDVKTKNRFAGKLKATTGKLLGRFQKTDQDNKKKSNTKKKFVKGLEKMLLGASVSNHADRKNKILTLPSK